MRGAVEFMLDRISEVWCKTMHRGVMWPINGKYTCAECLREYAVEWGFPEEFPPALSQNQHDMSISTSTPAATTIR